jgi:uncharacterized protein (TIGR02270 family)
MLLGDRSAGSILIEHALSAGPFRRRAAEVVLRALPVPDAHAVLTKFKQAGRLRALVEAAGIVGDPAYAAWLLARMQEPSLACLAGEAFGTITGIDIEGAGMTATGGPGDESVPIDAVDVEPEDPAQAGLVAPDPAKLSRWWNANKGRYRPGARYFMGAEVREDHCRRVLIDGCQRQRRAAAVHLALMLPGAMLFPTGAPTWRQQRLLANLQ